MVLQINGIPVKPNYYSASGKSYSPASFSYLNKNNADTVCFSGKSNPSEYITIFDYMAANILENSAKHGVKGDGLSKKNISKTMKELFDRYDVFGDFKKSLVSKIKWKSYIPQDVREFSIGKINDARVERLNVWKTYLNNAEKINPADDKYNQELVKKLKNNKSLKFVIWHAITSEINEANRHIPVPFDEKALLQTIQKFERILPIDRRTSCSKMTFLETYTHRLRDNLLTEMGLSNNNAVWVRIPSIKHDRANSLDNISHLEILSNSNWCTRSSVDKARAALEDGDFYIYLKRNSVQEWEPLIGMACSKGKIDQIQGPLNNNIVPLNLLDEVKSFISQKGLKCASGVYDEGPKAQQAIKISEKLSEKNESKKTFNNAINEKNSEQIFKFLNVESEVLDDGLLKIGSYKPYYLMDKDAGSVVPYSMFGIDENALLKNVKIIDGNLYLTNKNSLLKSRITKFPPNLESVTGRVICSTEQYEKFGSEIEKVVCENKSKIIISDNK